jgi:hypothetical protein
MSRTEKTNSPAIGLDIGTSRIVVARQTEGEIEYESQLNAFVTVPFSQMTANALAREGVPHVVEGDEIAIHGNESERFAELLDKEIRRTMTHGILNPEEPEGLRVIRDIAASLVGHAKAGQKLCFAVPAAPLGAEESLTYHEAALRELIADFGFEIKSISEGLAVVYAELESTNYTGIGISCGGGLCNVCLSYLSIPILSFSIAKAGDFIDASAAAVTGDKVNRVRMLKEQAFRINGHFENKLDKALGVYYDDMIQSLVAGLRKGIEGARNAPKFAKPIPLVLSGGTSMPPGFRERFQKALSASEFPIELSEVRLAAAPLNTTAKGALISAML